MKKLLLIAILVSLAWGQEIKCQFDNLNMIKTGESTVESGKFAFKWKCPTEHITWITTENENAIKKSQQIQKQQVLPDYSPIIEAFDDPDGDAYEKGYEEGRQWAEEMKKTQKGTIILYIYRATILYGIYLLIQG